MTIDGAATPNEFERETADIGLDAPESVGGEKGPHAFRTISEVADELHVPQHTLRLWETQFHQVRPLKRGGGRRYYRPDDVVLLSQIADLLYTQGYTVKGVQRLLQDGVLAPEPLPDSGVGEGEPDMVVPKYAPDAPAKEDTAVADYEQVVAVAAELPAAVEAGLEQALVQVMGAECPLALGSGRCVG